MPRIPEHPDLIRGRAGWWIIGAYPLVAFAAMIAGKLFHAPGINSSTMWPANGVLLGTLLLLPATRWAWVIAGTIAAQFAADGAAIAVPGLFAQTHAWDLIAMVINIAEAIVPAAILRRLYPRGFPVWRVRALIALMLIGGFGATALAALLGAATITMTVPDARFAQVWNVWWLSDALGLILIAPLIAWAFHGARAPAECRTAARRVEGVFAGVVTTLAAVIVFTGEAGQIRSVLDFPFIIVALLIVMAMRYEPRLVFAALLAVALVLLTRFDRGGGPFLLLRGPAYQKVLAMQLFVLMAGVPIQLLTVRNAERALSIDALRQEVAARELSQRAQRDMIDELDHRVRNNLASVLALIDLSAMQASDVRQLARRLSRRVGAMSGVHDALSRSNWNPLPVGDLVRTAISGDMTGPRGRVKLRGPELSVPPVNCAPLTIALSELAANAAAHGALSPARAESGRAEIEWEQPDSSMVIRWRERWAGQGPPAAVREGAGLALARGLVEHELHGRLDLAPRGDGFDATLTVPVTNA